MESVGRQPAEQGWTQQYANDDLPYCGRLAEALGDFPSNTPGQYDHGELKKGEKKERFRFVRCNRGKFGFHRYGGLTIFRMEDYEGKFIVVPLVNALFQAKPDIG